MKESEYTYPPIEQRLFPNGGFKSYVSYIKSVFPRLSRYDLHSPPSNVFHWLSDKEDWHGPGVYVLGDFYVGRSKNIYYRVLQHNAVCKGVNSNYAHGAQRGAESWRKRFGGLQVPIAIGSYYPGDELAVYNYLSDLGFPLRNGSPPTPTLTPWELERMPSHYVLPEHQDA